MNTAEQAKMLYEIDKTFDPLRRWQRYPRFARIIFERRARLACGCGCWCEPEHPVIQGGAYRCPRHGVRQCVWVEK
jgi:hypothetical protein